MIGWAKVIIIGENFMTLTQLKYIIAVSETLHFAEAAKKCFVTQPTLSMQIQKLEDWLQVKIFDRSKSPVQMTEVGKKVVSQAKEILKESERLEELVKEERGDISGNFRLGIIPTIAPYLVPLFLKEFSEAFPKVKLKIEEMKTRDILELLQKEHIDAGILATPVSNKEIKKDVLYYEPFHAFISPTHQLAEKTRITEDDLDVKDAWLLEEGHCFRDQMLKICHNTDRSEYRNVTFSSGSLETVKNMVKTTPSFTLLPHLATQNLSDYDKSLVKRFSGEIPTREISIVSSPNLARQTILKSLKDVIIHNMPENLVHEKGIVIPVE